jgi:hypothetical protein
MDDNLRYLYVLLLRAVDRDQHRVIRALSVLASLAVVAYALFVSAGVGIGFGKLLRPVPDPAAQYRLLVVGAAVFWLVGFCLLAGAYWTVLFRDRALPQLLTMPLTSTQLFVRKLRTLGGVAAVALLLTALLNGSFALAYGGWDARLLGPTLLSTLGQGMLNVCVPLVIALFALRPYARLAWAVGMVACLAFLASALTSCKGADVLPTIDACLQATGVAPLAGAFPGSWSARVFYAAGIAHVNSVPWLGATCACCLACVALIGWRFRDAYGKERVLAEFESPPVMLSRRRREAAGRDKLAIESRSGSMPDRVYEYLFDRRQRSLIALALRHDFTSEIGSRLRNVAGWAVLVWLLVASLRLPDAVFPVSRAWHLLAVLSASGIVALCALSCWFRGAYGSVGPGDWRRGQGQSPYHELIPVQPVEQLRLMVASVSIMAAFTWVLFLPAAFTAPTDTGTRFAIAIAALALPVGMVALFGMIRWLGYMRHPHRSPRGGLVTFCYWTLGIVAVHVVLLVAIGGPAASAADAGDFSPFVALALVPLLCAVPLYPVWRALVTRHNYDVEGDLQMT